MPRTKRPAVERAKDDRSDRQRDAERELLTAPCRHHAKGAVCDQCVSRYGLDSLGFPNVTMANGRGRYRLCEGCSKLRAISEWHLGSDRCQRCHPVTTELGALPGGAARLAPKNAEELDRPHRLADRATGIPSELRRYAER
jgi:hypothetical protein